MNRRRYHFLWTFLAIFGVLVSLVALDLGQAAASPISNVHLTLTGKPTSMVVTWRAEQVVADAVVKAWPAQLASMPEGGKDLIAVKPGQHTYRMARDEMNVCDATIEGLTPNTSYNYQISCGGATSPVYSFQTPVEGNAPFVFSVMGDCRGDYALFGKLIKMAREAGARFVLFTGDMTDSGTQPEWDLWFRGGAETLPFLPVMPLLGNHEMLTKAYFEQFVLPNSLNNAERSYYFSYGPVQFTVLYDGDENGFLSGVIPWMKSLFAANPQPWKLIAMHKPPYASVPYIINSLRDGIAKAAEESGAAMLFSGHRHTYERTFPLIGGKPAENGVVYVVTGGAGAPLDETAGTDYTPKAAAVNHFVLVNITAANILCTVKNADGSVIDEFTVAPRH